jgi:threonine synthase
MARLSYPELAARVLLPFVGDAFTPDELRALIDETYADFRHSGRRTAGAARSRSVGAGAVPRPDAGLQGFRAAAAGRLLDAILERRGEKVVIMGATSGDTGSAAIAGCQHCATSISSSCIPTARVSEVQRRQMTTLSGPTMHNLAIEGNFDDCQAMVKASFRDQGFLPDGRRLVAVNSINWARIMAQIVYYFYAGLALGAPHRAASYSVPTGNFGDIFAGYLASRMGLPVARLMIATNRNDVLHRLP